MRTDIESIQRYLRTVWSESLRIEEPTIHQDFFQLGGSSMQAVQMLVAVLRTYALEVDLDAFFDDPSIDTLSRLITAELAEQDP